MCSTLGAWCISQLRRGTGPKTSHPEQKEAQRDCQIIVCLLIKPHGFIIHLFFLCSLFCLSLWSFLPLWNTVKDITPFAQCVWFVAKEGVEIPEMRERRGGWGVCMRALWVLQRVSDRKRERL